MLDLEEIDLSLQLRDLFFQLGEAFVERPIVFAEAFRRDLPFGVEAKKPVDLLTEFPFLVFQEREQFLFLFDDLVGRFQVPHDLGG